MKLIVCGPPHSGKSVFIANLIERLPTDDCIIIRACPDGEGNWSNNEKQRETSIVRKKGKFTKSFTEDICRRIEGKNNKIVLIDVGGMMSKENEQIFRCCDSFVVLSSDEKKKEEWLEFCQKHGLECVACLDSSLEGEEKIYSRTPYFHGRIVGLERGITLKNSSVLEAVVSDIVEKSGYIEKTEEKNNNFEGIEIDDTKLGFELGYGKEIFTEDAIPIKKVKWSEDAIPKIYEAIQEKCNAEQPSRIYGVRANFILCAICKVLKQKGVKNISTYDVRTQSYIPIKDLPKKKGVKQTEGLSYTIIENKENVFLDIDVTKEQYFLEDYEKCVLPKINERKNLYISGRIPLWLLASISSSYDSSRIFTFQPGKGFTCVSSIAKKDLGTIVEGIEGIDINQYFEDKKDNTKSKLPVVTRKKRILSSLKGWIENFRNKREKDKYLDDTIRGNLVKKEETVKPIQKIVEKDSQLGKSKISSLSEQTIPKSSVGKEI